MKEADAKFERALAIVEVIELNPNLTQEQIGLTLGLSVKQVRKTMKEMIDGNLIRKEGGKRFGQWKIIHIDETELIENGE